MLWNRINPFVDRTLQPSRFKDGAFPPRCPVDSSRQPDDSPGIRGHDWVDRMSGFDDLIEETFALSSNQLFSYDGIGFCEGTAIGVVGDQMESFATGESDVLNLQLGIL